MTASAPHRAPDQLPGPPLTRRSTADRIRRPLLPLVPFLLVLAAWLLAIVLFDPPIGVLPRPLKVLEVPFSESEYWPNVLASLQRLILGFLVAAATGLLAGLAAGLSRVVSDFVGPLVTAMNAISGIAWIPLAIAWFGIGTA
ncbi:MAG: hypothetical protein ACR2QK_23965, partial [Acidimicrobiales bacterium]